MRKGYFGRFGGFFVPEILVRALQELEESYFTLREDEEFLSRRKELLSSYVGRPTPLYPAHGLSEEVGGAFIYLKREDLAHTGSHKINNALGQALLAKWMGKDRVIAETGAGQHGVATATACALLGLDCEVYMGEVDAERQKLNRYRMELLGAEVRVVKQGTRTLKDAINEALRDFATNSDSTHYLIGSVVGPHPYPTMVRDFQSVIGEEVRSQIQSAIGGLPDSLIACVGGGSNALGLFHPFIEEEVEMHGVEAGGKGIDSGKHSASIVGGSEGVLHGAKSYILQDLDGQIMGAHSIAAGLDYPGVGPEHASLNASRRVQYHAVDDEQAVDAFHLLSETEGIPPALESAHAIAFAVEHARELSPDKHVVVNLSGRGDKDVEQIAKMEGEL